MNARTKQRGGHRRNSSNCKQMDTNRDDICRWTSNTKRCRLRNGQVPPPVGGRPTTSKVYLIHSRRDGLASIHLPPLCLLRPIRYCHILSTTTHVDQMQMSRAQNTPPHHPKEGCHGDRLVNLNRPFKKSSAVGASSGIITAHAINIPPRKLMINKQPLIIRLRRPGR
jgi:hypothetical protein